MTDPNTLGEMIRERRLARGLSLGQLATAVGRTAATVRSWERGQHLPAADIIDRLATALQVSPTELEDLMYQEPPSLTVVGDTPDEDAVTSVATSVSSAASIETAEGEGDDDTAEIGEVSSAAAEAAAPEPAFVAGSADELGIMPRIEAPPAETPDDEGEGRAETGQAPDLDHVESPEPEEVAVVVVGPPADGGDAAAASVEDLADSIDESGIEPGDEWRGLIDEPTAPIGPPIAATAAAAAPAPAHVGVAVRAETLREPELPPFLAPLRAIFDPHKKWLYWIRGASTVVALLVLFVVLSWAAGQLFDGLGDVLDTIESTDTLTSDLAPLP